MNFLDRFRKAQKSLVHRVLRVVGVVQDVVGDIQHQLFVSAVEGQKPVSVLLRLDHGQIDQHGALLRSAPLFYHIQLYLSSCSGKSHLLG